MPIDFPDAPIVTRTEAHVASTALSPWQPAERVIVETEKARPGFCFREEQLPAYTLPDVLSAPEEPPAQTREDWERRVRPALLERFGRFVYGRSPAAPTAARFETVSTDPQALGGTATHRRIRVVIPTGPTSAAFVFDFSVFFPNRHAGKVPAILLLNNRGIGAADPTRLKKSDFWPVETLIARGYATAALQLSTVQVDKADGPASGLIGAFPVDVDPDERWATLAAWAWAASRVLDALQSCPEIDGSRVAVVGHSRGGKAALWAGATDSRFGMVIANGSGCGGAALSRRPFGETVAKINEVFPHWFCGKFKTFNGRPERLPVDQHQLLALVRPRPLYVGCADEDLWADPRGEFIALAATSPVGRLYGQPELGESEMPPLDRPLIRGGIGYHVRTGTHDLTAFDWQQYLAFADRMWK